MISNLAKNLALPSVALGASAWLLRRYLPTPVTVVLLHTAAVGACLVLGASDEVIGVSSHLLGKNQRTGQLAAWSYPLWWPYHAFGRARIALKRRKSTEPLWNEIAPGWYLGGWPFSAAELPSGPLAEVDCTCELPARPKGPYHNVPLFDTMAPSAEQTDVAVRWALAQRAAGQPVYIFCQNGHGRSGVVATAAMVAAGLAPDWEAALKLVQGSRPKVKLNKAQRDALVAWAEKHGKST